MSLRTNAMGFRTNANGNGPSDQWYFGPMGHRVKYCIGIFKYAYIYYVIRDLYFILCMPIIILL